MRSHPTRGEWLIAAGTFLLLALLAGGPDLWHGRMALADERGIHLPNGFLNWRALREGMLPLWNPYAFTGIPQFASHYAAALYPPAYFFYALLPPFRAFGFMMADHSAWAGLGMWYWLRNAWRNGQGAALIGGAGFMLSGFMLAHAPHAPMIWAIAWMPWILAASNGVLRGSEPGRLSLAAPALAACIAWQIAAGYMQMSIETLLVAGAEMLFFFMTCRRRQHGEEAGRATAKRAALWCAAVLLGLGIVFVQLHATREILPETYRGAPNYVTFTQYGFTLPEILTLWFPLLFGSEYQGLIQQHYFGSGVQPELVGSLAGPMWLGIGLCAALPRAEKAEAPNDSRVDDPSAWEPHTGFWLVIALLALSLLFGPFSPLARLFFHIPVLGLFRIQTRWMIFWDLAVCAVAAQGFDRLLSYRGIGMNETVLKAARRCIFVLALVCITAYPLARLWLWLTQSAFPGLDWIWFFDLWLHWSNPVVSIPLGALAVALGVGLWLLRGSIRPGAAVCAWLVLIAAEQFLLTADVQMHGGPTAAEAYPPRNESAAFLLERQQHETFREFTATAPDIKLDSETLFDQMPQLLGIDGTGGNWPLILSNYSRLMRLQNYGEFTESEALLKNHRLLDMLNVRYVLIGHWFDGRHNISYSPNLPKPQLLKSIEHDAALAHLRFVRRTTNGTSIYENTTALPRVWSIQRIERLSDNQHVMDRLWDSRAPLDLSETALVAGDDGAVKTLAADAYNTATLQVTLRKLNRIDISVAALRGPAFVVVSEAYHPGWLARIDDGPPQPVIRTDAVLRGVVVPQGSHTLSLRYQPQGLRRAAAFSGLCLLAWGAWLGWLVARRRRRLDSL